MLKIAATGLALIFSLSAFAGNDAPLMLNPMDGEKSPSVTMTMNVYGKCGSSVIAVIGVDVESYKAGSLKFDDAGKSEVLVRTGKKEISLGKLISDSNLLHCVPTKSGARLLFGSVCGGSACGDAMDYSVIDPSTGTGLSDKKKACDEDCANKLLGFKYLK